MDYVKHYSALIQRARTRTLDAIKEEHHVIPRCLGGRDCKNNLVELTPEEHLVAHLLLVKMFPQIPGLVLAAVMMSRDNRNGKRANNKLYGWLRRRASEVQSIRLTGRKCSDETKAKISAVLKASPKVIAASESRRGVKRTDEVKKKLSESSKNSEAAKAARLILHAAKVGVARSDETKRKIGIAGKGRKLTPEHRAKIGAALKGKLKGRKLSAEHIAKISATLTGYRLGFKCTDETKLKMSIAATGRKMSAEAIEKMVNNKTPEQRSAAAFKAWETKRKNKESQNGTENTKD